MLVMPSEILLKAQQAPVGINKNGKAVAVVVSPRVSAIESNERRKVKSPVTRRS